MSEANQTNIYIIGAGVSGLTAAIALEEKGYSPIILESTDSIGGRVKTDIIDGFQLDHGFQVLLEGYPMAQKHLNYDELKVQKFLPGAMIFDGAKSFKIGDPLRDSSFLFSTLFAAVGSFGDKMKILKLNKQLKKKSLEEIFYTPEKTTHEYLRDFGFSDKMISMFFRPFFAGIFLEPDLKTSSRMFEFVYKMFGEGLALLPKGGIGTIPEKLKAQLKTSEVRLDTSVTRINNQQIALSSGDELDASYTVVATDPRALIPQMDSTTSWKSCDNLYFTTPSRIFSERLIGLNARADALVNNIFYSTSLETESKGEGELLSVTVVRDHDLTEAELVSAVTEDLKKDFGIEEVTFLKTYKISQALPELNDLQYSRQPSESMIMENVALAGDHLLNGSLNAAMISGESAAEAIHEAITGNRFS